MAASIPLAAAAAPVASASPAAGAPALSPGRQAPQVKLQPLGSSQAQQFLTGAAAPHAASAAATSAALLAFRAHTKHQPTHSVPPALQSLDFVSIADSSVGGGGVPRPYGRFNASRAGNGNATYKRLPPPAGSWQARALPVSVTLLTEAELAEAAGQAVHAHQASSYPADGSPHRPHQRQPHGGHEPGTYASDGGGGGEYGGGGGGAAGARGGAAAAARRSRSYPHLRGHAPATFSAPTTGRSAQQHHHTHSQLYHSHAGTLGGTGTSSAAGLPHEASQYRRPGSSLHRSLVPLPPPDPYNPAAWFALPSATFLTDMPMVPENLRTDNGYSVSRDFLLSGLQGRRAKQQLLLHQIQQQQGTQPGGHTESALLEALDRAAQAAQQAAAYHPGGPMGLRGVYVPLDNRAMQQQAQQQQAAQHSQQQQQPHPHQQQQSQALPQAVEEDEERESLLVGEGSMRATLPLPPEQALPRRHVPSGR